MSQEIAAGDKPSVAVALIQHGSWPIVASLIAILFREDIRMCLRSFAALLDRVASVRAKGAALEFHSWTSLSSKELGSALSISELPDLKMDDIEPLE